MTRVLIFVAVLVTIGAWIAWNASSFLYALAIIVAWILAGLVVALMCASPETDDNAVSEWQEYVHALDEATR